MFLKKKVGRRAGRVGALEGSPWLFLWPFLAPGRLCTSECPARTSQVLVQRQHPGAWPGRQSRPPSEGGIRLEGIVPSGGQFKPRLDLAAWTLNSWGTALCLSFSKQTQACGEDAVPQRAGILPVQASVSWTPSTVTGYTIGAQ